MHDQQQSFWEQLPQNGRSLIRFWTGFLVIVFFVFCALEYMGPVEMAPEGHDVDVSSDTHNKNTSPTEQKANPPANDSKLVQQNDSDLPGNNAPKTFPDLQQTVLDDSRASGGFPLPHKSADGQTPSQIYAAAPVNLPPGVPKIAILVDGIGQQSDDFTKESLDGLPTQISLAVSPYVSHPKELMDIIRQSRHEFFLSLPMQGKNTNDFTALDQTESAATTDTEGPKALDLHLSTQQNLDNAMWSLSRLAGYVGVTNAFDSQNGGDFPRSSLFTSILQQIEQRGLYYVNTLPNMSTDVPNTSRTADVTINTNVDIVNIDIQLLKLQQIARQRGYALGVLGPLQPVALACLRAWLPHLKDMGIALVPVSQVMQINSAPPQNVSQDGMRVNLSTVPPRM